MKLEGLKKVKVFPEQTVKCKFCGGTILQCVSNKGVSYYTDVLPEENKLPYILATDQGTAPFHSCRENTNK